MWPCVSAAQDHTSISSWSSGCSTCRPGVRQVKACVRCSTARHTRQKDTNTHTKKALKFRDSSSFCCPHTKFLLNKNIREAFETYFGWSDQTCLNASHYQPSLCDLKYQRTNQRGQHAGSLGQNLSLAQRVSVCQFCSAPSPGMGSYLEAEGAPGWMLGRRSSGSPQQAIS